MKLFFKVFTILIIFALSGCSNTPDQAETPRVKAPLPPNNLPVSHCKQPSPVMDIWKLEPMLTKQGKIKENMSHAEKESIIRAFIAKKNQQYQHCIKGTKKP